MAPPVRPFSLRKKLQPLSLLPGQVLESVTDVLARRGGSMSAEVSRALPDSKGGEEPKDLQRWRTDHYVIPTVEIGVSQLFYTADQWVRINLMLETAGPVAVSTRANIVPVLSGKGRLLTTDVPLEFVLPKGSRLYYAAENINRLAFTVEPIPWGEQLSTDIQRVAVAVRSLPMGILRAFRSTAPDMESAGPPPPASRISSASPIQRLTKMTKPGRMG
jgi:hypothetical protein